MSRIPPGLWKARSKPEHFRGRMFVRVLDLTSTPHYPHKRWTREAIGRWLVTSGINITRPYKKKRNWFKKTITFRQRQAPPAERVYLAHCELP